MDALHKRYGGHPFPFVDGMIRTGRFEEFVDEFVDTTNREIAAENEEREMRMNWEFFLHKVLEGSFADFMEQQKTYKQNQNMTERTIETTIQHSNDILNNFNPEKGVNKQWNCSKYLER